MQPIHISRALAMALVLTPLLRGTSASFCIGSLKRSSTQRSEMLVHCPRETKKPIRRREAVQSTRMRLYHTHSRILSMCMRTDDRINTNRREGKIRLAMSTSTSPTSSSKTVRSRRSTWNQRFDELCRYSTKHGHCLVPIKCDEYPGLGVWVRNQRTHYRNVLLSSSSSESNSGRGPYLQPERIQALQSLGFTFHTMQRESLWKKRFDELLQFRKVYGHCLVPEKYHDDPTLGNWVAHQRRMYKNFFSGGYWGWIDCGED